MASAPGTMIESIDSTESTTSPMPKAMRPTSALSVGKNIVTANRTRAMGTSRAPSPNPSLRPSAIAWVSGALLGMSSDAAIAMAMTARAMPRRSLAMPGVSVAARDPPLFAFELRFAGIWC